MKINWGTGIVIGIISFMCFILYFVITMSVNKKYDHDLVSEQYYKDEMAYQTEIDSEKSMKREFKDLISTKTTEGWVFKFPDTIPEGAFKGKVSCYRPSNSKLDFELPLKIVNGSMLIPKKYLLVGRWNIRMKFQYQEEDFLYKETIYY